jgi:hypothetical protein
MGNNDPWSMGNDPRQQRIDDILEMNEEFQSTEKSLPPNKSNSTNLSDISGSAKSKNKVSSKGKYIMQNIHSMPERNEG